MSTSTSAARCSGGSVASACSTAIAVSRAPIASTGSAGCRLSSSGSGSVAAHLLPAEQVEAGVDDDAVQPGGHGRVAAERPGAAVGRDQRVLDRVGRVVGVAERTQRNGPEPVAVPVDELAERLLVTREMGGQQGSVGEGRLRRLLVVGHVQQRTGARLAPAGLAPPPLARFAGESGSGSAAEDLDLGDRARVVGAYARQRGEPDDQVSSGRRSHGAQRDERSGIRVAAIGR